MLIRLFSRTLPCHGYARECHFKVFFFLLKITERLQQQFSRNVHAAAAVTFPYTCDHQQQQYYTV